MAPLLWLMFVHGIVQDLYAKLGESAVNQALTLFADDHHWQRTFTDLASFEAALDSIGVLFNTLTQHGMHVSPSKSKAAIILRGTLSGTVRKRYLRSTAEGVELRLHLSKCLIDLPVVSSFSYLGAQVGYGLFENQTLDHRICKAKANFWRLVKVLRGRHQLGQHHRISLYRSCVWSSLSYALDCCGITRKGAHVLHTLVLRHLRGILRSPAHLDHTTDVEILNTAGLLPPLDMLRLGIIKEAQVPVVDSFILSADSEWVSHLLDALRRPTQALQEVRPADGNPIACSVCGVMYIGRQALLSHMQKAHPEARIRPSQTTTHTLDKAADARNGLPQCTHCQKHFTTWNGLRTHIEGGRCTVLSAIPAHFAEPQTSQTEALKEVVPVKPAEASATSTGTPHTAPQVLPPAAPCTLSSPTSVWHVHKLSP